MRKIATLLIGLGAGAIVCASPACADDNQFLAHLKSSGVVHPALSDSDLLLDGRMACIEVGKEGLPPDSARIWIVHDLEGRGVPANYAAAGTLVHYALQDLCPEVPNTTGL
jgi:hypothetical protein